MLQFSRANFINLATAHTHRTEENCILLEKRGGPFVKNGDTFFPFPIMKGKLLCLNSKFIAIGGTSGIRTDILCHNHDDICMCIFTVCTYIYIYKALAACLPPATFFFFLIQQSKS